MNNVETSIVSLTVRDNTNTAHVTTTSHHSDYTSIEANEVGDLSGSEIDLDGIFKRLLLLQKKKYAAVKVEDMERTSTEVKGLDMKRREYCNLSKTVSQYVSTMIEVLSGTQFCL